MALPFAATERLLQHREDGLLEARAAGVEEEGERVVHQLAQLGGVSHPSPGLRISGLLQLDGQRAVHEAVGQLAEEKHAGHGNHDLSVEANR